MLISRDSDVVRRHGAIITPLGEVVKRPRVLPQDRYLVNAPDGLHYQAYRRAGWLWRVLHRTRWRCISGKRAWLNKYDAWRWVESQCVNRAFANDWHGVGFARWMQQQTYIAPPGRDPRLPPVGIWSHYTTEPAWVHTLYRDGPPQWSA